MEHHSQSDELSCANSAVSVDFQEQLASTIGLFDRRVPVRNVLISSPFRFKSRRSSQEQFGVERQQRRVSSEEDENTIDWRWRQTSEELVE